MELQNYENMENTLKIKVFIKSILVCKYLCNESSNLYEIWNFSLLDIEVSVSVELRIVRIVTQGDSNLRPLRQDQQGIELHKMH